ncbi:MAG: succinate dehydrogenase, cytochrome b556 subunit [Betaproteobacteria bacterium]
MPKSRPKHLNLLQIRFPIMAIVSGLHRISGAVLFLFLPLLLWLWQQSVVSQQTFERFSGVVASPLMKIVLLGLLWSYLHHLCAGIRHLALDLQLGIDLPAARASGMAVMVVSLALTIVIGALLW